MKSLSSGSWSHGKNTVAMELTPEAQKVGAKYSNFFPLLLFNLPAVPLTGQILPEQADTEAQTVQSRVVSYFVVNTRAGGR